MFRILWRAIRIGGGMAPATKLLFSVLRTEGIAGIAWRLNAARKMVFIDELGSFAAGIQTDYNKGYEAWQKRNERGIQPIESEILISILMPVYRPPITLLREAIESVRRQSYQRWQLCIADDHSANPEISNLLHQYAAQDSRIKVCTRTQNGHISAATNSALEMADGQFIALLDNDDELHPDALAHVAAALHARPDAEILYSDEDKLDTRDCRQHPYFKSRFNRVLFLAQNMISHLGVYRSSTVRALGGFRLGVEGAQDWDLALRVVEAKGADKVVHIPRVLYHWREIEGSTARSVDEKSYASAAQVRVVQEHLQRIGRPAHVEPAPRLFGMVRVRHCLPKQLPLVSIIIPSRDRKDLLEMCIGSLFEKTAYSRFEVIVVDNGSREAEKLAYLQTIQHEHRVNVVRADIPFNYSTLNNLGVASANGEYILMLNNDIEFLHPDWLHEMMSWAIQPETGCVGARLWYPHGTLQHGGVILGINGMAGHAHRGISKINAGYRGRGAVHQNLSAVTGACMLVKRSIYESIGGLDERFAVAYNDIDFCLRVKAAGYENVWTPYAEMNHHESATRGIDSAGPQRERLTAELKLMRERWAHLIADDPAYSPHLTKLDEDFSINQYS